MNFGLPYQEIIAILKYEGITSEQLQRAIAEVINKNNTRIMETVFELIDKEITRLMSTED